MLLPAGISVVPVVVELPAGISVAPGKVGFSAGDSIGPDRVAFPVDDSGDPGKIAGISGAPDMGPFPAEAATGTVSLEGRPVSCFPEVKGGKPESPIVEAVLAPSSGAAGGVLFPANKGSVGPTGALESTGGGGGKADVAFVPCKTEGSAAVAGKGVLDSGVVAFPA